MSSIGQAVVEDFPEIDNLTPLFQEILGKLRAAQVRGKRTHLTGRGGNVVEELEKYAGALGPRCISILWYCRVLAYTKPLREKIAMKLWAAARKLNQLADRVKAP